MGYNRKLSVATPPLQTLSRHKIFCRNRNGPALGKLCRDTRGPLSRPKHLVPALNLVVTQNFCCNTGPKYLSRQRKPLSRPKPLNMLRNPVATRRSMSRHKARKLCRAHTLRCLAHVLVAHARLLREPRPGCAPGLRTLSRHGRSCHDTGLKKPYRGRIFSIVTEDPKWAVTLSSPPAPLVFPFSFLSIHLNLNTQ